MSVFNRKKGFLFKIICGFFLGFSVIAPGVSGSVIAVMMGIYRDLIEIASNPFRNFRRNFFYLLPMAIGALISVVLSIKFLSYFFDIYPVQSSIVIMGLIAGGLPKVWSGARKEGNGSFKRHYFLVILAAFLIAAGLGFIGRGERELYMENVSTFRICAAGIGAGAVSVVPGMSVSLILMLFSVYGFFLQTAAGIVSDFTGFMAVAIPAGICFIAGLVLFSRIIKLCFDRAPVLSHFAVFGFMCGTLPAVFPTEAPPDAGSWVSYILLFLAGAAVTVGMQLIAGGMSDKKEPDPEA